ncbi:hypothetical protein ACIQRS_30065 [Streptomyces termitum]|uniref:ATP-binding protein n=1 Tax=Streptomyces termitum TaxID=67368 RepID=A0A918T8Z6_9ACTN|nr:ATP-binding protein [Streptomyces termitum]GHB06133.1 hypothetical protein GCM10010305_56710 [Streptomyces termitum]
MGSADYVFVGAALPTGPVPDPAETDRRSVEAARRRFLRHEKGKRPLFGLADRATAHELFTRLLTDDETRILVCDGPAGMGKSAVVGEVVALAHERGWPVLPFRMDEVEAADRTAEAVGGRVQLGGCPASLLARVARGAPALLVVDQLDAASSYSGRIPEVFEAVDEMLEVLDAFPNVRTVLVARTIDVEKDPRLMNLVGDRGPAKRFPVGLLDDEAVAAVLARGGTPPQRLGGETLRLLRTPLHLSVFCRLSERARNASYRNLADLYATYTDEVRRKIEKFLPADLWPAVTHLLVDEMSRRETVTVPYGILDRFAREDLAVLVSAGVLLHGDNDRIGFFHETYFDYLFARSFVLSGKDLHDFLATGGQALFRRAQTRQVLEHLRETDRAEFRRTAVRLLGSDVVRPHLRFVVVSVLEQLDATDEDWAALDPLAWDDGVTARKLRGLLGLPAWFDATDTGRWERWLGDPATTPLVFPQLSWCTAHRPKRVTELMRPYANAAAPWPGLLQDWLWRWPTHHSAEMVETLIEQGYFDEGNAEVPGSGRTFWDYFRGVAEQEAETALRLLGTFLRRAAAHTASNGGDPLDSDRLNTSPGTGIGEDVSKAAAASPRAALDHLLPFVVAVAEASHVRHSPDHPSRARWYHRLLPVHPDLDEALYWGVHDALRTLAQQDPDSVAETMRTLSTSDSKALRFLACRVHTVWNRPDEALAWLMADPENLRLGWVDSARWASRELVSRATRDCGAELLERFVHLLLDHYPAWERLPENRQVFGHAQYVLLDAVAPHRRSPEARRRLGELERKFSGFPLVGPKPVTADFLGPPVPSAAGEHMSDAQWLRALRKHAEDRHNWRTDPPTGGARELAQLLGSCAKVQPDRFTALAQGFDRSIPAPAFVAVIDAVAGKVEADRLLALCAHAHDVIGGKAGRSVCGAIGTVARDLQDLSVAIPLLAHYADDPHPASEAARTSSGPGKYHYGGDLLMAGINSTRGEAAIAIGALLRLPGTPVEPFLPALGRLVCDPVMAVRVCAAEPVTFLLGRAPETALDLAELLFTGTPVDVHETRTVHRLLTWSLIHETARFAPELLRALDGPDEAARYAGAAWAVLALRERLAHGLPGTWDSLPVAARRGAAEMTATDPVGGVSLLRGMFDDNDPSVRKAASRCLRKLESLPPAVADELIGSFLTSRAFPDHAEGLAASLAPLALSLPARTLEAGQALAALAESPNASRRFERGIIHQHLIEVVLRLYRRGDERIRSQCLDIIDALYRAATGRLDEALSEER